MDFPDLSSILKQFTLGVSFGKDSLHLSLLSLHWKRLRRVDRQTIDRFDQVSSTEGRRQVQDFLKRNEVTHCNVVLSLPHREVLVRELELPLEARDNLAKVVDYQMVNLLPSEEQAISYDYLVVQEASNPPRLRATIFVILQSTLERYLDLCRGLGLSLDRIVPQAVAVAEYVRSAAPKGRIARRPGCGAGARRRGTGGAGAGTTEAVQGLSERRPRSGGNPRKRSGPVSGRGAVAGGDAGGTLAGGRR